MSDQLREALRALTDDVVDMSPPADSWRGGQRLRRRSALLGGGVGVLAALLAGALLWTALAGRPEPQAAAPVHASGDPHIPDQLWAPSPWLSGTADEGPLGPLALIGVAERHTSWLHAERAVFGVSSLTGEYRYLDLPDLDGDDETVRTGMIMSDGAESPPRVSLSPNGTKVAYCYRGTPTGSDPFSDVVGFAVYDTATGDVTRYPVGAARGLDVTDVYGPLWSTDGRYLWLRARVRERGATSTSFLLDTTSGHLRTTIPPVMIGLDMDIYGPSVEGTGTLYPQLVNEGVPKYTNFGTFRESPDGSLVAIGYGTHLYTAPTPRPPHGETKAARLAAGITVREGYGVLGWSDDTHIVVALSDGADKIPLETEGIARVNVSTGAVTTYVEGDSAAMNTEPQLATALIDAPLTSAARPETVADPRPRVALLAVSTALVLLVGAFVLSWLRGRRRADELVDGWG